MMTEDFRSRARAWLEAHAPSVGTDDAAGNPLNYGADVVASRQFQRELFDAGFAGITWPAEYGGQGLGVAELLAWAQAAADFVLPNAVFGIGHGMIGPTLIELGSEEQKRRYLKPMLTGEEIWCQLFSEPGGGSDVAALRTKATKTSDGWVIDGQKVWTSGAQHSDFGAILARTDPTAPKHDGITMFIVDMHHPGVTVRPLRIATGDSPFNEVFFDQVEVPNDAIIGTVNEGWSAAVVMLRHERIMLGAGGPSRTSPLSIHEVLATVSAHGSASKARVSDALPELYAREVALEQFGRLLHEEARAGRPIGARGSVGKLASTHLMLWASDLVADLIGEAFAIDPDLALLRYVMLYGPGHAVAGGSSEIQRNIIGERILGLPKDGGIDSRGLPFNQLRFGR